jgi:drug/metabolite transporter (DMT)-like permease
MRYPFKYLARIPGQAYLWLAVIIFGASGAITRKLIEVGDSQFMGGDNPISLCNVLFVGNLCALGLMLIIYHKQLTVQNFQQINKSQWVSLVIVGILSGALAPAAIFQALETTPVNNIVLLGRLEVPLVLVLSRIILKEKLHRYQKVGTAVVLLGIVISFMGGQSEPLVAGLALGEGELLTIIATVLISVSNLIIKQQLSEVPLGINSIFKTGLGTFVFFWTAIALYGSDHFGEVLHPYLWQWMLIYGGVIIVVGQSFWLKGLRTVTISLATLVSCFHPIAGMFFSYLILSELPTLYQILGGGVILLGLLLSQKNAPRQSARSTDESIISVGFKGF